ncbi:uncharacterized protein [Dysidea avara]|uniref:uncharacterized protein n=1 Tax=Dysidea avara TaxID=196820 RepID=UPI0033285A91
MNNLRQRLSSFLRRYNHTATNTAVVAKVSGWTPLGCHTLAIDSVTSANQKEHMKGGLVIANSNGSSIGVTGSSNCSEECQFRLWQLNPNKIFCLESVAYDNHYLCWDVSKGRVNLTDKITEDDKKNAESKIWWTLFVYEAKYLLQAHGDQTCGSSFYLVFDFANQLVKDSPIEAYLLDDRNRAVTNAAITFTPPIFP